jgi:glycosyltransferase involved in cell wall biosynthesis
LPAVARLIHSFAPHIIQVEAEPWSAVYAEMVLLRQFAAPRAKLVFFTWWNTPRVLPFPFNVSHRLCLAATDGVIAGNHGALEVLAAHGFRGPVAVVPQWGINDTMFQPGEADARLIAQYGLGGRFVIGFVGRLTSPKGVNTLLSAAASIHEVDYHLLVVGDGPEHAALKQMSTRLGIAERVTFAGSVHTDLVADHLRCMDVLVLPSTRAQWEQFGHVLIEAMACGVPVVGSQSGEIPYVIDDAGLVFPIGDSQALADCLRRVNSESGLARTLREKGLERVRMHYTHAELARRLRAMYRSFTHSAGWDPSNA